MPMSFSGKRYRRTRWENIDNLCSSTDVNASALCTLKKKCIAPIFSYREMDDKVVELSLECEGRVCTSYFTLGEVTEMKKPNGTKIKVRYTLEGDNILHQYIVMPEGKISHFRKEFREDGAKMTVTIGGTEEIQATIYYEVVK